MKPSYDDTGRRMSSKRDAAEKFRPGEGASSGSDVVPPPPWLDRLIALFPENDRVSADSVSRTAYSHDATYRRHLPEAVVLPRTTQEVADVLRFSYREGVPVFPRGGGSGLSGGSVPLGGIALVLTEMNRILWVDERNLQMRVEAGALTEDVRRAAEKKGLLYPPDPGSAAISTVGGNIAEDAAGSRSFHYGTTRRHVLGLTVVLPGGKVVETGGRTTKNATGFDLTQHFIGSEGLLGVVTEATLRLLPRPEAASTVRATFFSVDGCGKAILAAVRSPARPTALEFLDRPTMRAVEAARRLGLPAEADARAGLRMDAEGMLFCRIEGGREAVVRQAQELAHLFEGAGGESVAIATDPDEQERIRHARNSASPAVAKLRPTKISEDATVPVSAIPDFIRMVHALGHEFGVQVVLFGHAGDGNFHPCFLCDERDPEEFARVERAVEALFERTLELGGTLSGEHGIGLLKAPFMQQAVSRESLDLQRAVKRLFDPKNLLNPGKMFPKED